MVNGLPCAALMMRNGSECFSNKWVFCCWVFLNWRRKVNLNGLFLMKRMQEVFTANVWRLEICVDGSFWFRYFLIKIIILNTLEHTMVHITWYFTFLLSHFLGWYLCWFVNWTDFQRLHWQDGVVGDFVISLKWWFELMIWHDRLCTCILVINWVVRTVFHYFLFKAFADLVISNRWADCIWVWSTHLANIVHIIVNIIVTLWPVDQSKLSDLCVLIVESFFLRDDFINLGHRRSDTEFIFGLELMNVFGW